MTQWSNVHEYLARCIGTTAIVGVVFGTCFGEVVSTAWLPGSQGPTDDAIARLMDSFDASQGLRAQCLDRDIGLLEEGTGPNQPNAYIQQVGEDYVVVVLFDVRDCLGSVRLVTKGLVRQLETAGATRLS